MALVINSLGGRHTHMQYAHAHADIRTETILRNQVHRPAAGVPGLKTFVLT